MGPAHRLEPRRNAKLGKRLAALGHRGAQGAALIHDQTHPRSGDMQSGGCERRVSSCGGGDDSRIE
jgi:hypothetical protein